MTKSETFAREASQQDKLTRHEKGTGPEQSPESAIEEARIHEGKLSRTEDDAPLPQHKDKQSRNN